MSAFLGPIHYWLYKKIQLQEELTRELVSEDKEAREAVDAACGTVETRALEEVIDTTNIHGWLQNQIIIAESRYAKAVTVLLQRESVSLEQLETRVCNFGKKHGLTGKSAAMLYKELQDLLLDGMPCDHVNMLVEQTEEKVSWKRTADLHAPYWEKLGTDGAIYYQLRRALLKGMLSSSAFSYYQEEELSYITK